MGVATRVPDGARPSLTGAAPVFRHLLAVAPLPVTVAVLVPFWIAQRYGVAVISGRSAF